MLAIINLVSGCLQGPCTDIGCEDGVTIWFVNEADNVTYDVTVSTLTSTPETLPVMQCSVTRTGVDGSGVWTTNCESSQPYRNYGTSVVIKDTTLDKVVVTVSVDGTMLSEQMFDLDIAPREINGPGCGTCTSAGLMVDLS